MKVSAFGLVGNEKQSLMKWLFFAMAVVFVMFSLHRALGEAEPGFLRRALASGWPLLLVAFALMPLNWSVEALKWQILTRPFSPMPFSRAFRAVTAGVFFGFLTPNRLGDLGGKLSSLPPEAAGSGVGAFVLGSMAQASVTLLVGALGFRAVSLPSGLEPFRMLGVGLALAGALALMGLVLRGRVATGLVTRWFPRVRHVTGRLISPFGAGVVVVLSMLRYAVFLFQFLLCLRVLGAEVGSFELASGIAVVYLLTSFVPSAVMGELGIREGAAIVIIAPMLAVNGVMVAAGASFVLWCINLVIPGLAGGWFFARARRESPPLR